VNSIELCREIYLIKTQAPLHHFPYNMLLEKEIAMCEYINMIFTKE
jgi:hypothetical protein